jgi:hypothetical protein
MNTRPFIWLGIMLFLLLDVGPARAGPTSKVAQEVAEYLFRKGSKEVIEHGVEAFARKIEAFAVKHGEDVFLAVKALGAKALPLIEQAGAHGTQAAKILAKHGEHGAVWVVSRPRAMNLVVKHGEGVASALVKHPGIAETLIEKTGSHAIAAFTAVGPQAGRRLAILAEGEAAHVATNPKVLEVVARYGEAGMAFIWKHKGALAVTATLAVFLADPEPFIKGAKDITQIAAENAIKPLAEATGRAAESAVEKVAPEVGKNTNWTVVILASLGGLAVVIMLRIWLRRSAVIPFNPPMAKTLTANLGHLGDSNATCGISQAQ